MMTWIARPLLARTVLALVSVFALASLVEAQTISGSGELLAKNKLSAKGCGRGKLTEPQTVTMMPDGTWTVTFDGSDSLGGTYTPLGSKGRAFDLTFDAQSLTLVEASLEEDLSELCQTLVQVTSIETKRFRLKLNRKATKVKLKAKLRLTGTANGETGKGSFKVKAKGPWTPMLPGSPSGAFPAP